MAQFFGMRRRRSFWYAQAQVNLVCAGAGHFFVRRRKSIFHAHAQLFFFLCAGHLLGTLLFKFYLKDILNFFSRNLFLFFKQLVVSFGMCFISVK